MRAIGRFTYFPKFVKASSTYALVIGFPEGGGGPRADVGTLQIVHFKVLVFPHPWGLFSFQSPHYLAKPSTQLDLRMHFRTLFWVFAFWWKLNLNYFFLNTTYLNSKVNFFGCLENSDPRPEKLRPSGVSKTQTPKKLRPSGVSKTQTPKTQTFGCLENSDPKNSDPWMSRKLRPRKNSDPKNKTYLHRVNAASRLVYCSLIQWHYHNLPRKEKQFIVSAASRDSSGGYFKPDTTFRGPHIFLI